MPASAVPAVIPDFAVEGVVPARQQAGPAIRLAQKSKSSKTPKKTPQKLTIPPQDVLLLMVRTHLIAVDQANKTNNYTVLRALGGPGMQRLSAKQLSANFADLRKKQIDLSPVSLVPPTLTQQPVIKKGGILFLAGFFPTKPLRVRFEMAMRPIAGFWRLEGLSVNLETTAKAAGKKAGKGKTKK